MLAPVIAGQRKTMQDGLGRLSKPVSVLGVRELIKRGLDIFGAGIGLIILSPVLLVIMVMIHRQMGAPVLFRQSRPGLHGKPFQMIKFRTMLNAVDVDGRPLPDAAAAGKRADRQHEPRRPASALDGVLTALFVRTISPP